MPRCVVIPVEGPIFERECDTYEDYRDAVGGYIEFVPGARDDFALYVNEDGIMSGLPRNPRASQLVRLFPGDFIKGTAVLFGTARMMTDGEEADSPWSVGEVEIMTASGQPDVGGGKNV